MAFEKDQRFFMVHRRQGREPAQQLGELISRSETPAGKLADDERVNVDLVLVQQDDETRLGPTVCLFDAYRATRPHAALVGVLV